VKSWEERPIEVAHLLNPAFCGEVLRCSIQKYNEFAPQTFPYSLSFLVLPIVLHRQTRESISLAKREQLHTWMQEHQDVRIGFAERARRLVPFTKEALTFLLQVGKIIVDDTSGLKLARRASRRLDSEGENEALDCFRKAEIVGRWFARAGNPANIYTMLGVKP
jgi:hypothetical protein